MSSEVIGSSFGNIEATICELLTSIPPELLNALLHALGLPSISFEKGCSLFRVDAEFHQGCWILLVAVLLCEVVAHVIMELGEAAISERMAMLSAYHRSRNPLVPPTRTDHPPRRVENQGLSVVVSHATSEAEDMGHDVSSHAVRRLLVAQEVGSLYFVGSWFDFLYGGFPRRMWTGLVKMGLMKRVPWMDIGGELRADLVNESEESSDEEDDGVQATPHVPLVRGMHRRLSQAEMLAEQLLEARNTADEWLIEDSPLSTQHEGD